VVLNGLLQRFEENERRARWALMQATIYHQRGESAEQELIDAVFKVLAIEDTSGDAVQLLSTNASPPEPFLDKYRRTGEFEKGAAFAERLGEAVGELEGNEEWVRYKGNCFAVASECYANIGENEKAEKAILRAIEVYPRQANFHNSYGLLLRYMGRIDDAIAQWNEAIKKQVDLTWAWENLGSTYVSQGKIAEARKALTQGLEGRDVSFGTLAYEDRERPIFVGERWAARVGPAPEYGMGPEGAQNGWDVVPAIVDISDSSVVISYPADLPEGEFPDVAFNGYLLDFLTDCVLFAGATPVPEGTVPPMEPEDVFVEGATLFIDVGGRPYGGEARVEIALDVLDCPLS